MALDLKNVLPLALLGVLGVGWLASGSGTQQLVGAPPANGRKCSTRGYRTSLGRSTKTAPTLSPSLRGCDALAAEVVLAEHEEQLPAFIDEGSGFKTEHHYSHPKRNVITGLEHCKVVTVCRSGKLTTFLLRPNELLFGTEF